MIVEDYRGSLFSFVLYQGITIKKQRKHELSRIQYLFVLFAELKCYPKDNHTNTNNSDQVWNSIIGRSSRCRNNGVTLLLATERIYLLQYFDLILMNLIFSFFFAVLLPQVFLLVVLQRFLLF